MPLVAERVWARLTLTVSTCFTATLKATSSVVVCIVDSMPLSEHAASDADVSMAITAFLIFTFALIGFSLVYIGT